jgi:uncharacterized protein
MGMPTRFNIVVNQTDKVTGILYRGAGSKRKGVTLLLGHGAGADQTSTFMVRFAEGLADRGIDAVTFNFLYKEQGRGTPDRTEKLEACYTAAIDTTRQVEEIGGNLLVIGGKSMGGRIASQVAAAGVEDLTGLVFLGYPLHPPGKPDQLRSKHLGQIREPMLFVQGTRDSFGSPAELRSIIEDLTLPATVYEVEGGDHSFKVRKGASTPQERVYDTVMDEIAPWIHRLRR